jgi:hypothetical protein
MTALALQCVSTAEIGLTDPLPYEPGVIGRGTASTMAALVPLIYDASTKMNVRLLGAQESQIVPLPLGGRRQGGEPAPEIQIDPAAFVFHTTERLTICFFL